MGPSRRFGAWLFLLAQRLAVLREVAGSSADSKVRVLGAVDALAVRLVIAALEPNLVGRLSDHLTATLLDLLLGLLACPLRRPVVGPFLGALDQLHVVGLRATHEILEIQPHVPGQLFGVGGAHVLAPAQSRTRKRAQ
eukprot:6051605-Prymnesium_polylepis.1